MKRKLNTLSRRYALALRKHLQHGPHATLEAARGLGRRAVKLGLETLDVARIHTGALATLEAASSRDGIIGRAEIFFTEVVTPIEMTHLAALKANDHLVEVNRTLARRAHDLAASKRSLKQSIRRRKSLEKALEKSGGRAEKLLEESRRLQKHLRSMTRRILTAQEDKRKKISHELQDEIAQTLLGINVRLLLLKTEAAVNAKSFAKDIAQSQRLVDKSVSSIKRFVRG